MKLSRSDRAELDDAMTLLYNNGLSDGDIGYAHRAHQIDLIKRMIRHIDWEDKVNEDELND